jgi:hypothetical protein
MMAISIDAATVHQVERVLARDRLAMPLPEALGRRLGVESWMLTLDADGRLRAITVLGGVAPPGRSLPASEPATTPASPLERRFALAPGGALSRLLGEATATGQQLADLVLRHDDQAVRAEAVRVAVDAMTRDPALERALLGAVQGVDDAGLAATLAGVAGDQASTLVRLVAEQARGRPLGRRAARVLDRLDGR